MTTLAIDTASATVALALREDEGTVRSVAIEAGREHSRVLLPAIEGLLEGGLARLTEIVVVVGPGSYAGLRVGIATARALALARGVPVQGVGTLEAVAAAVESDGEVLAIQPAGRGTFAAQAFRARKAVGELLAARAEELVGRTIAGEGAAELGGEEVGVETRCRAALALGAGRVAVDPVDAVYLGEPTITLPRRRMPVRG